MSDTALAKFLQIRTKWDPNDLFPTYKRFIKTHEKIDKLMTKPSL